MEVNAECTWVKAARSFATISLGYKNRDVFQLASGLGHGVAEMYLEARGAYCFEVGTWREIGEARLGEQGVLRGI